MWTINRLLYISSGIHRVRYGVSDDLAVAGNIVGVLRNNEGVVRSRFDRLRNIVRVPTAQTVDMQCTLPPQGMPNGFADR